MPVYALDGVAPELPPAGTYWIAPDAHVIGRVRLAAGVGIWFGAVLRGDQEPIEVGPDSNVQEHAMLHTDAGFPLTVGARCTVGHRAILHGCSIGDQTLIGMGATVLNGTSIASHSLVGAGALVTERKSFPERSLVVGVPAIRLRELDDGQVDGLARSAAHYVETWRRFAARLERIA